MKYVTFLYRSNVQYKGVLTNIEGFFKLTLVLSNVDLIDLTAVDLLVVFFKLTDVIVAVTGEVEFVEKLYVVIS